MMDESILSIQWDTGYMNIVRDAFFPCSLTKFKKLLKVIDLDWEHSDTLKADLKAYFQKRIAECQRDIKGLAQLYSNLHQQVIDTERMVKTRKKPVGVRLTTQEFQKAKADLAVYKANERTTLSAYKKCKGNIPKFERLLQAIE